MKSKFYLALFFSFSLLTSSAQHVDFTLRFNNTSSEYEVYAKPDADFKQFFVGGGSQISVVLPAEIENQGLLVETVAGGPWLDNSQIYAPKSCPGCDFHGIASNGSLLDLKKGEEKLLFTFVIPSIEAEKSIRLFDNTKDPQSNANGMGGGDFNNYFACALTMKDAYRANYKNEKQLNGTIKDWLGNQIDLVEVTDGKTTYVTDNSGQYQLGVLSNQSLSIKLKKNIKPLNGLNTLDIIKIQQHILENDRFVHPEQWVAADVNKSGTISAVDIFEIRQLLLGNQLTFKNNISWRFVNNTYQYIRAAPLKGNIAEVSEITQLTNDETINFTAIKVGDVNGTAVPNSNTQREVSESKEALTLKLEDAQLKSGDIYTATVTTDLFNQLQGYQLSLQFESVSIQKVQSVLGTEDNFGLTQLKNGLISTSWNKPFVVNEKTPAKAELFKVTFKAERDGRLSEMLQLSNQPTAVEGYDLNGNIMEIQLVFISPISEKPFELYQNEPNPFKNETMIGFYLPADSPVEMVFRDEAGRVLKTIKEQAKAGYNSFLLNKKDFARGLIFYQLDTNFGSLNRKMLRLE